MSFYNSLEPQAEEERNHSQPRAKEEGNIISNIVRKSEEVARLSKTLNLMRKKVRASVHEKSQNLVRKRIEVSVNQDEF